MSDSVTNVEIEDVLSSIRRLVSTDAHDGSVEGPEGAAESDKDDKLVLTPAHRVDDPPGEGSSDVAMEAVEGASEPSVTTRGAPDSDTDDGMPVSGDKNEGEVSGEGGLDLGNRTEASSGKEVPGASETVAPQAPEDTADEADLEELEAQVAGLEAAVAEQDEEWEPDGSPADDDAGAPVSLLPWRGEASDDTSAGAAGIPGNDQNDADDSWYDDTVIDEDMLRDMVSEIVRKELQGALGERITRNVRKLVRREIHRALMSQRDG